MEHLDSQNEYPRAEEKTIVHEHIIKNKPNKLKVAIGTSLAAAAIWAGLEVKQLYDDFRELIEGEAGDRTDYSALPGVGVLEDLVDVEVEPVNVEELLLEEAESLGVSGMGVQPLEFTGTQDVFARDIPSIAGRFAVNASNLLPGINNRIPDGNWESIAHAWVDISGYTFAVSPHDGYELSINKTEIDPHNIHASEVPQQTNQENNNYTVTIDVTDVHVLDTLVQFPEASDTERVGYAIFNPDSNDFVEVSMDDTDKISEIEHTWRSLLNIGIGTIEMPNTYTIAQEATNIAKEELIVGGHIGNVALAATCDLANGVEQSFRSFVELQKREGIMPDDTQINFNSDVSVAMENFKNTLLSAHMVQQDGSYGPVAPGSSLVSSRAHLDAIDAIPTACSQLDSQPQNLSVMVESATEAKHQAAAVALMTHNSASSTETVTTTNSVNLGDIHTNPIRAGM